MANVSLSSPLPGAGMDFGNLPVFAVFVDYANTFASLIYNLLGGGKTATQVAADDATVTAASTTTTFDVGIGDILRGKCIGRDPISETGDINIF